MELVRFNVLEGAPQYSAPTRHWHFSQEYPQCSARTAARDSGRDCSACRSPSIAPRSLLWLALWHTVALSVPAQGIPLPAAAAAATSRVRRLGARNFCRGGEKNGGDRASLQNREMECHCSVRILVFHGHRPSATASSLDHGGPPIEAVKIASSGSRRARAAHLLGLLNVPAALYLSLGTRFWS